MNIDISSLCVAIHAIRSPNYNAISISFLSIKLEILHLCQTQNADINNKGNVTTKRPGIVKFTVTATDGSNKLKTYTLIVKPKKTSKPRLSTYYNKQLYIDFDTQYGSDGYQIQYATNKSFKNAKTKKITSSSITLKNLKKNKKYYVRVRAYVKKGKKLYPGAWSSTVSKKVK